MSIHEASHGVVAKHLELPVMQLSLCLSEDGSWEGCVDGPLDWWWDYLKSNPSEERRFESAIRLITCCCAGIAGELVFYGDYARHSFSDDLDSITLGVLRNINVPRIPEVVRALLNRCTRIGVEVLSMPANQEAVRKLAQALRDTPNKRMNGVEALTIIRPSG